MKAASYTGNRKIQLGACTPVEPLPGQVRIRVSHCEICGTDLHIYHGTMDQRVKLPAILGHEMSGVIKDVGEDIEDWAPGDRVTFMPLDSCGLCPACTAGHSHICQNLELHGNRFSRRFPSLLDG